MLDSYRGNIVAIGGESCSSCRLPGSSSYVVIYNWMTVFLDSSNLSIVWYTDKNIAGAVIEVSCC